MKKFLYLLVVLLFICNTYAGTVSVPAEHIAQLRKIDVYCVQDDTHTTVGWNNAGSNMLFTAVTRFDLSSYHGNTLTGGGTIKFYARIKDYHSEDPYGFRLIELNKSFEFYSVGGWQLNGLNWDYRNSNLDPWTQGDTSGDGYYFNKGAIWDTTYGDIGTFAVNTSTYSLVTVVVPQVVLERWLNGQNYGLVIAPVNLLEYRGYQCIDIAGPTSGFSTPVLEFDIPVCGDDQHPYPTGDINHDCSTDLQDLKIMAQSWLLCTDPVCD